MRGIPLTVHWPEDVSLSDQTLGFPEMNMCGGRPTSGGPDIESQSQKFSFFTPLTLGIWVFSVECFPTYSLFTNVQLYIKYTFLHSSYKY